MSRQEIRSYGKQEFGSFPLITMEELPRTLPDYYKVAIRGDTGTRIKNKNKHLICEKTAKSYLFWDNLIYHYKHLAPLCGKKIEFKEYISCHDGWLFNYPENLKLHNKVAQFEQAEATHIEQRVNIDNSRWKHPSERNMERYCISEGEEEQKPKIKKSRFLKKDIKANQESKTIIEDEKENKPIAKTEVEDLIYYKSKDKYDYPFDPDMLEPLPKPKEKNVPDYYGWTHSEDADSWFLESHTPSVHEPYEKFYSESLRKKVICPKLYSLTC